MNHAGNLVFIFRFHRDAVAVIAHGNNRILEIGAVGTAKHACKLGMNFVIGKPDTPANMF